MPLSSVLIVGGCGFLGHHIVKLFQELHPETSISVLDLRTNTNRFDKVTYYDGDITDNKRVAEVLRDCGPQVVVNTVSPVYGFGAEVYFKVNVEGTRVLLEECAKANVQAFVFTSSASVVFNGMYDVRNADETAPYASPHMDAYNDSKAQAEVLVLKANHPDGMKTAALRVSGLFGPGDRQMIPGMVQVIREGKTGVQIGSNENLFDCTYIENAAYAHVLAAEKLVDRELPIESRIDGECFFITNGEPVFFWDWARAIWAKFGHIRSRNIVLPVDLGLFFASCSEWVAWAMRKEATFTKMKVIFATKHRYFNIKKARVLLGYKPRKTLAEGLDITVQWFKEMEAEKANKKNQ